MVAGVMPTQDETPTVEAEADAVIDDGDHRR
jgi:hypothetical protein